MVNIRELFNESRFPSGWKLIPLLLYAPIGLILAIVRIFIGIQALIAASLLFKLSAIRSVVLRFMCGIIGIIVLKENEDIEDESVKVIVSNHVSLLDHLVLHLLHNSYSFNLCELPTFFHHALNYKDLGSNHNQEVFVQNVKGFLSSTVTIDVQPELGFTSGKKGLLRFSAWPCKLSCPIQPVAIKVWRPPLTDISPSVINASWSADFFWFLFVPFTVYKVRYIPVEKLLENETPEDMSKRIEKLIAKELNISTTNYTINDKLEFEKRLMSESTNSVKHTTNSINLDPNLIEMASKVKEVLPDVPLNLIYKDLGKTKNVNLTVANFLEGRIKYTPELNPRIPVVVSKIPEAGKTYATAQPSTSFDTSSKTFPKSAQERMISFQERKLRLIQSARQRYIEKHALNLMSSS